MKDSYLDTQLLAKHIEFEIWIVVLLRKFMMLNLMKPRVPKMIQLLNAMKNMDVGELRPSQVNDDEDNQVWVPSNTNLQDDTNQASTNGSHDQSFVRR